MCWIPPPQAVYKLNYDVAVFENSASSEFGAVIRNTTGEVMAVMTVKGLAIQGSEVAELLACRKALEFAIDAGFTVLIVEGDNVKATRCIALGSDIQSAIGHVVSDIRHLLGAMEWASVSCTKRNGNRVAHVLARNAQNVNVDLFWMEEVPSVAIEYVNIDASLI
ncbi:uncharacterized protein LOC111999672 [Quercus suber]|uniref:uncharacterized protein LOC111999672 n=1 Tax=Quercus suber TaxID=58331 RepID=UPI0032DFA4D0